MKSIDEIREGIITALNSTSPEKLLNLLNDTNPGHYGVDGVEFNSDIKNLWIDVPQLRFTYENVTLSFNARIGGSRDGADNDYSVKISGEGKFEFKPNGRIAVTEISTGRQIDLYPED